MNILHALLGEHGPLRHQLSALRKAAPQLDDGQLRAAALSLAEAIETHAQLEDELLFVPLAASAAMPAGPVEAMRAEHQEIEALLGHLMALSGPAKAADPQRILLRLVETVRQHFSHEENVLFPLAASVLSGERLAELAVEWAKRREVVIRAFSDHLAVETSYDVVPRSDQHEPQQSLVGEGRLHRDRRFDAAVR